MWNHCETSFNVHKTVPYFKKAILDLLHVMCNYKQREIQKPTLLKES